MSFVQKVQQKYEITGGDVVNIKEWKSKKEGANPISEVNWTKLLSDFGTPSEILKYKNELNKVFDFLGKDSSTISDDSAEQFSNFINYYPAEIIND